MDTPSRTGGEPAGTPPADVLVDTGAGSSPYKNLWVPLVVVPFLVVGVLVLVYLFFGAITGRDATPAQNLERIVSGGANESKQAAASLVAQMVENQRARLRGEAAPWPLETGFLSQVEAAWQARANDDDAFLRLALAQVALECGDPAGYEKVVEILRLPDERDPRAEARASAMLALAALGDGRSAEELIPFLAHGDPLLRLAAAGVLQRFPGAPTEQALEQLLGGGEFELRGQAAISLAHLGRPSGAPVLREMLSPESYAEVHRREPKKYAKEKDIQASRVAAVEALARLGRAEDRDALQALAASDADLSVREAALRALERIQKP